MELTISVPDDLGRRVRKLPDRDRFVTEALLQALGKRLAPSDSRGEQPSRWARLAAEIEQDPVHLDGYSEQLERAAQEFREGFRFQHDRDS